MNKKYILFFMLSCLVFWIGIRADVHAQTYSQVGPLGEGPNGGALYHTALAWSLPIRWHVTGGTFRDGLTSITIWGSQQIEVFWNPDACNRVISMLAYQQMYDHRPAYHGALVVSTCPPPPPPDPVDPPTEPIYAYKTCEEAQRAINNVSWSIPFGYRNVVIQSIITQARANPALRSCSFSY